MSFASFPKKGCFKWLFMHCYWVVTLKLGSFRCGNRAFFGFSLSLNRYLPFLPRIIYSILTYILKIVGHIAEACTSTERLCYNCRQPGHESSACPSPRSVSTKQCYGCGGVGHIQSECPTLKFKSQSGGNGGGGQKCFVRLFFLPSILPCALISMLTMWSRLVIALVISRNFVQVLVAPLACLLQEEG